MASQNKLGEAAKKSVGNFFTNTEENKPEQTAKESRKPYTNEQMDEALKAVYRSGRQQDGADLLNINKGTFSRNKREIEENEPERVERLKGEVKAEKATAVEAPAQDIPQTPQKPQTAQEPTQAEESTLNEKKSKEKANIKQKKQVFSFRAAVEDTINWKAYAIATGQTMETIGTAAMNEYLENHKLTGAEQAIFEAMKERNKNK